MVLDRLVYGCKSQYTHLVQVTTKWIAIGRYLYNVMMEPNIEPWDNISGLSTPKCAAGHI